jgi:hypothetical protein
MMHNWKSLAKSFSAIFLFVLFSAISLTSCGGGGGGATSGDTQATTNTSSYSKQMDTSGGTFEVTDTSSPLYGVKLDIPAGALSNQVSLSISVPPASPETPATFQRKSSLEVKLGPSPLSFQKPVLVKIPYNDAEVDENNLVALLTNEQTGEWETAEIINLDTIKNEATVSINHFSVVSLASDFKKIMTVFNTGLGMTTHIVKSIETDNSGTYYVDTNNGKFQLTDSGVIDSKGNISCVMKIEPESTDIDVALKVIKFLSDPLGLLKDELLDAIVYMKGLYVDLINLTQLGAPSDLTGIDAEGSHTWTTPPENKVDVKLTSGQLITMGFSTYVGFDKANIGKPSYFVIKNNNLNEILYNNYDIYKLDIDVRVGPHIVIALRGVRSDFTRKIVQIDKKVLNDKTFSKDLIQINVTAYQISLPFFKGKVLGTGTQFDKEADSCGVPSTYSIAGKVTLGSTGLSGVTVTLSGANSPLTTDANGSYSFSGISGGNYTITPSKTGYTFSPVNWNVTVGNVDVTKDFTATLYSTDQGLVAYYSLNGNANDASGNGHNGTVYGNTTFVAGKLGNAAYFDGSGDFIQINPNYNADLTNHPVTFASWVKVTQFPSFGGNVDAPFIDNDVHQIPNRFLAYKAANGTLGIMYQASTEVNVSTTVFKENLSLNTWYHIAVTLDGQKLRFYIDGSLVNEANLSYTQIYTWNGTMYIGGDGRLGRYLTGYLDEIRVYNRALSGAEIQALYLLQ